MNEIKLNITLSNSDIFDQETTFDVRVHFSPYRLVLTKDDLEVQWTVQLKWPEPITITDDVILLKIEPDDDTVFPKKDFFPPQETGPDHFIWTYQAKVSDTAAIQTELSYNIIIQTPEGGRTLHKIDPILVISG